VDRTVPPVTSAQIVAYCRSLPPSSLGSVDHGRNTIRFASHLLQLRLNVSIGNDTAPIEREDSLLLTLLLLERPQEEKGVGLHDDRRRRFSFEPRTCFFKRRSRV
jgi:hypothetical protein